MNWSKVQIGLATLAVCAGVAGLWFLIPYETSFGLFEADSRESRVLTTIVGFLVTLGGVVVGAAYRVLDIMKTNEGRKTIGRPSVFFGRVFRSIDLWMSLAAAPIVYGLILQSAPGMSGAALTVVALQNGFCCLALVNTLRPTVGE